MKVFIVIIIGVSVFLLGCKANKIVTNQKLSIADSILQDAFNAHGGKLYDNAHYQFVFRNNTYRFKNKLGGFDYSFSQSKEGEQIEDKMNHNSFVRTINGKEVDLSQKEVDRYKNSLNSVIYFASLPHKLLDPAVNLSYVGESKIKGKSYDVLKISFDEEGGGKDHEDIYHYWINKESKLIDYLAYNFKVNKGGARFRSAFNTRNVNGIVFQDYKNYKAPFEIPLIELGKLYEEDKLELLSEILTEDVKKIN